MNLRRPLALLFLAAACSSNADTVCENVAACEQGGSSELVQSCQDEAKTLEQVARAGGCGGAFDDYYTCAESSFTCEGATASFPGCDDERLVLDDCLARTAASNACGELARKTAGCHAADAGVVSAPAPACTAARECAARCYLDAVGDPCAPGAAELSASATCTASCPR
jgi:hypothetical protein